MRSVAFKIGPGCRALEKQAVCEKNKPCARKTSRVREKQAVHGKNKPCTGKTSRAPDL